MKFSSGQVYLAQTPQRIFGRGKFSRSSGHNRGRFLGKAAAFAVGVVADIGLPRDELGLIGFLANECGLIWREPN